MPGGYVLPQSPGCGVGYNDDIIEDDNLIRENMKHFHVVTLMEKYHVKGRMCSCHMLDLFPWPKILLKSSTASS